MQAKSDDFRRPLALVISRLLIGALLPIPLTVAIFTVICDLFHFNKDDDYIRLADSTAGDIAIGFVWYVCMGAMLLGIPSLLYSAILEWRRRGNRKYFPVSLWMGLCFGLCIGYWIFPPWSQCRFSDFAEAFTHFFGTTLLLGMLIPALLQRIGVRRPFTACGVSPRC